MVYQTGKVVANIASAGDADNFFYVAQTRHVYVSGVEGFLYVFEQQTADQYRLLDKIATGKGGQDIALRPGMESTLRSSSKQFG